MLVGIPALAGAPVLSSTVHGSAGTNANRRIVGAPTPGIDQALRELSTLHNQMVQRGPARSDARLIAPPLRSLMTYHQQSNRDIELSAALRDLVAAAWAASEDITVGWPETKVSDIEAGRVDPYEILYGID